MLIETGGVYEHTDHEEVLVLNVQKSYTKYDSEADESDQTVDHAFVVYAVEWGDETVDINPESVEDTSLDEFESDVGEKQGTVTLL